MKFLFQFSPKSYQPLLNLSKWFGDFSKYMYLVGKKPGDAIYDLQFLQHQMNLKN